MDEGIRAFAKQIHQLTDTDAILRQGVVTAVAADGSASVKWGNNATASPAQRCLASYMPLVGDTVWGVRDGDVTIVLGPVSAPWVDVGAVGAPAFQNSWVNHSAAYNNAGYSRTGDVVRLRGLVKNGGNNTTIFQLPAGFRPGKHALFPSVAGGFFNTVTVQGDGTVTTGWPAGGNNSYVTLEGITFTAGA